MEFWNSGHVVRWRCTGAKESNDALFTRSAPQLTSNMEKDVEKKREIAAAEKAKGNKFFGQRNYRQAIEHYSKVSWI